MIEVNGEQMTFSDAAGGSHIITTLRKRLKNGLSRNGCSYQANEANDNQKEKRRPKGRRLENAGQVRFH